MGIFDRIDRLADQLGDLIAPDDVRAHVELGGAYLERGDLDAATVELRRALELRPDHPRAAYLLGIAHARAGQEALAIEALSQATAARSPYPEAELALAELLAKSRDFPAAEAAYHTALESGLLDAQGRAEAYRGLGRLHLELGRLDKAIRELRKAAASLPGDAETLLALGRALLASGHADAARLVLVRLSEGSTVDWRAYLPLGEALEALGRQREAETFFQRAIDASAPSSADEAQARTAQARIAYKQSRFDDAAQALERALAIDDRDVARLHLMGRTESARANLDAALSYYDRALVAVHATPALLLSLADEALRLAILAGQPARARTYAEALLAIEPKHALATASLAIGREDVVGAEAAIARALGEEESVALHLVAAEFALRRGDPDRARLQLQRALALSPEDATLRERLAAAHKVPSEGTVLSLADRLRQLATLCAQEPELSSLRNETFTSLDALDRPLLVAVMGEFNAGKSTFVNALLGAAVLPVGVTPTTATINVLKHGRERGGRIVYRDGTSRELSFDELKPALSAIDSSQARLVQRVEIRYPLELLERIHIVDTPGFNSIDPDHEATARAFLEEADAIIWLFSIDQAAKATENSVLTGLRARGRRILGVVNKIDRADEEGRNQAIAHVRQVVGGLLDDIVPVSSRDALIAASGFPEILSSLETHFFARARTIKEEIASAQLQSALAKARALVGTESPAALEAPAQAEERLHKFADALNDTLNEEERRLRHALDETYGACAHEVLEFVRPRRWALGSNDADPADRDFLVSILDDYLGRVFSASRARVAEIERAHEAPAAAWFDERDRKGADQHIDALYERARSFVRGYLRGGAVDRFFVRDLPKLELSEAAVRRTLSRTLSLSDEALQSEWRAPLGTALTQHIDLLVSRAKNARRFALAERIDREERLLLPLERIA